MNIQCQEWANINNYTIHVYVVDTIWSKGWYTKQAQQNKTCEKMVVKRLRY